MLLNIVFYFVDEFNNKIYEYWYYVNIDEIIVG